MTGYVRECWEDAERKAVGESSKKYPNALSGLGFALRQMAWAESGALPSIDAACAKVESEIRKLIREELASQIRG